MKVATKKQQNIITKLIEQDLVYYRFVGRLNWAGLTVSDSYTLVIEDLVYELMGLNEHPDIELIYDHYVTLAKQVIDTNHPGKEPETVAAEIFNYLEQKRTHN